MSSHQENKKENKGDAKFVLEGVNLKSIWLITLVTTAIVLVSWVVVGLMTNWDKVVHGFSAYQGKPTAPMSDKYPPYQGKPVLQADEFGDYQRYKTAEQKILNGYGWVEKDKGIAHVPVTEAMKRVLQKGLPARKGGEAK